MIHMPKYPQEWILFGIFWFGGIWTLVYEFYFVLHSYHQHWNGVVTFHVLLALFLAWSIYSNMYLLITTDISAKQINKKENVELIGWKYCDKCKCETPPRSHHCKLCDICVLKRDHHCWFAGYCVGFNNHRYFVCMALYMSIAGVYGNIYNWEYVMNAKGGFTWTTIPSFCAPHVGLVLANYTRYEFFITAMTSVGIFVTVLFLWLVYTQVIQIVNGQVMYERKKEIDTYNLGLKNTLQQIFGSAGLWVLLCPFIPTTLPSDGTHFPMKEKKAQ